MKIVAVCNQKGGVGKTSTSITLASFLGLAGKKTIIVDLDPQGNATSGLGIEKNTIQRSAYDILLHHKPVQEILLPTQIENLWLIPSNINLTGAEIELVNEMGREGRLKRAFAAIADQYDYCIIDCPPSLGILTINALTAAGSVLIPIQCEYYALEGLGQLVKTIDLVRDNLNTSLHIEGILMTMADGRTKLTEQVIQEVRKHFGSKVYQAVIPRSVKMSEAPGFGKPIMLYDKDSVASKKYEEFSKEFMTGAPKIIETHNSLQ
jgi:chromosome partitioning protein